MSSSNVFCCSWSLLAMLMLASGTALGAQGARVTEQQVLRGRQLVIQHACGGCQGPPDFWASEYTPAKLGPYPARAFPTANENRP